MVAISRKKYEEGNYDICPFVVVSGAEAIRAVLIDRLAIIQGEYLPNVNLGLPLGAKQDEIDLAVTEIILTTDGITGISKFRSRIENHKYRCWFTADTVYGGLEYGQSV